jgi:hypothetical protein
MQSNLHESEMIYGNTLAGPNSRIKTNRRRHVTLEFVYIFNLAGTGICVRYLGGSGGVEIPVLLPALAGVPLLHHAADLATTILVNEDDLLLRSICSTL